MNIFFGKISQKVDTAQLSEGYYSSNRGSTWFGELKEGDYVYMIGGDKIQFWKAREWGFKNGRESLLFDVLNSDLGINVSQLIALKFLLITKSLAVLTSRSARNRAFFKLETIKDFSITDLSNSLFYNSSELYRTIRIIGKEDIIENSEDIQLIYQDNKLHLVENDFIEAAIKKDFIDNLDKKGKGAKMKDNVLEFFSNAVNNLPAVIDYTQIGLRSFYDTFFCEYTGKDKYFLVGAFWDTSNPQDQTERFVREGIWFNGYDDKFIEEVNAVPVGSNIAIKAAFVREKSISVMIIKARGVVIENLQDGQTLKVEWEDDFVPFEVSFGGYMRTIKEVTKPEHIISIWTPASSDIDSISTSNNTLNKENSMKNFPRNQILYGPPGTGKTFNSINRAIEIINPNFDFNQERSLIKKEYDRLVVENQIVFTTFHQSMSYEDFIEGIKPHTKNEKVTYSVEGGVFKSLVKRGLIEYIRKDDDINNRNGFDSLYNEFVKSIKPLEGKRQATFTTKTGVEIMLVEASSTSILVKYLWSNNKKEVEGQQTFTVSKEKLKKVLLEGIEPAKIKNLKAELHPLIGHIHCELFAVYKKFYDFAITNKGEIETIHFDYEELSFKDVKEQFDLLSKEEINAKKAKPYIIIIDEINRGNVSAIFGELITLIEEDKRLGKDEALEVTLPYSKEKFGVPSNLYIIGTMNTADRSVEALDTALRRRFSFEEMSPRYDLDGLKSDIYGFEAFDIIETINKRIERLLDKDHSIGHSYFLNKTEDTIIDSFYTNIIPLLQEYFFGDYGKMGLVLGGDFIKLKEWKDDDKFFASFDDSKNDFDVKDVYEIIDYRNNKVSFKDALIKLMNK